MKDFRRRLVALFSALVILMAVVVLPGCKKDTGTQKQDDPNKAKTTAPATK
jgi:uncharacterized lipoprotein YajG